MCALRDEAGPVHVAIDARMINDGGIGTYLQQVVPRVAQNKPLWKLSALGAPERISAAGWMSLPNIHVVPAAAPIYSAYEQLEIAARCPSDANLFWAPHYNIPLFSRKPLAVTIHDVCHVALPEFVGALGETYAQFMLERVRKRARAVMFDSDFSRAEMRRLVGEPAGAVVAHLAVDERWFLTRARSTSRPLQGPYLVYVGNMKRHKNVPMLVRAFADVQTEIPHRLVLIGRREGLRADPDIDEAVRGLGERVVVTGEVGFETVQQFVAHADAYLTVSLYEGFGLPPLEAMAAGCPCVVSNTGSLPEVCGDAALYVDPRDRRSIANALRRIATDADLRVALTRKGQARAREFSWERCASRTIDALSRALVQ